jgi:hypothetical protein
VRPYVQHTAEHTGANHGRSVPVHEDNKVTCLQAAEMAVRTFPRIAEVRAYIQESNLPGGSSHAPRNSVEAHQSTAEVHGLGRCESTNPSQKYVPEIPHTTSPNTRPASLRATFSVCIHLILERGARLGRDVYIQGLTG